MSRAPHPRSWPLIRRLFGSYVRPHLGTVGVAAIFMLLSAAMTGALAQLMEPVIDKVFTARDASMLLPVSLAVMVAFTLRGIAAYAHTVLMNKVGQSMVAAVQRDMYAHLMRADLSFFHSRPSGELISRMTNDVTVMRTAMAECLTGIGKSWFTLIFLVAVMFMQDWRLALGAFTVFPVAAWWVGKLGKKLRKVGHSTQEAQADFAARLNQAFQGIRQIKAYGMEDFEAGRIDIHIRALFHWVTKAFRTAALSTPVSESLAGVAIVAVILYGGSRVMEGTATAGSLFSFITAFLLAYEPMKKLGKMNGLLQTGLAATDRVFKLLDSPPAITDAADAAELSLQSPTIELDHVTFSYPDGSAALVDFSLKVPAGKTVALVGASGAGKSTVLNLIPRFYDVQAGRVLVGGQDVRQVTMASLRRHLALVSQEVAIFDDSIGANIAYGRPGASQAEIEQAARLAAAHDFILEQDKGYETVVGEHGVKLSGGQRQRVAIARAMLRDAPILLLDEATSALDAESERAVQAALKTLRQGRTTLVIAHRLSTIIDADIICVLDRGRLVEEGSHAALLARGGVYARLYGLQAEAEHRQEATA